LVKIFRKYTLIIILPEIENAREVYEEEILPEVIYALVETVSMKDGYTGEHCKLVSEQAALFAKRIGLEEERIKKLKLLPFYMM